MIQLTADAFKARTELDPNWCSKITEPIEVIEYLNIDDPTSNHSLPYSRFQEKDKAKT